VSEPEDADPQVSAAPAEPAVGTPEPGTGAGTRQFSLRRAPRYRAFVITGVAVGVLIAAVLMVVFPDNGQFSARAIFGYVAVILALIFGLAGALIAIFAERPRRSRADKERRGP
jgi:hypothetical protein